LTVLKNDFAGKRNSKDKSCNAEGNDLIYFCETINLEILNGKIGSDKEGNLLLLTGTICV
jgi:hypothetical protein